MLGKDRNMTVGFVLRLGIYQMIISPEGINPGNGVSRLGIKVGNFWYGIFRKYDSCVCRKCQNSLQNFSRTNCVIV